MEQTTEGDLIEMNSALEKFNITAGKTTGGFFKGLFKSITNTATQMSEVTTATNSVGQAFLSLINGTLHLTSTSAKLKNTQEEYNDALDAGIIKGKEYATVMTEE